MKRDRQESIDGKRTGRISRADSYVMHDRAPSEMISPHHRETKTSNGLGVFNSPKRRELDRIKSCLKTVAELVEHDEAYLPIFLRLEAEFDAATNRQEALERAKSYRLRKS
jgi:hypothetical protein